MTANKKITLGIFAHANAGKTTITENLLYKKKVINSIGRVDSGNTFTDNLSIEKARGISVRASLATFPISENTTVQLIDTPGHVDFSAEVERTMSVLDGAVLVVSGVEGIEAQTSVIWSNLIKKNIPIIIFVNKMDRSGADFQNTVEQLRKEFGKKIIPIVDISTTKNNLNVQNADPNQIADMLSENNKDIFQEYFQCLENNQTIDNDWVFTRILPLIRKGNIYPVIGGSALKEQGIDDLLVAIRDYIPEYNHDGKNISAIVYSIKEGDQRDSYTKILSGSVNIRDSIPTDTEGNCQKITNIRQMDGGILKNTSAASAGDIVIINGLNVIPGTIIGENAGTLLSANFVKPLMNMEIISEKHNPKEVMQAIQLLNAEDPYLNARFEEKTGRITVSLMGEVQAQIIQSMMSERFNIDIQLVNPTIICKETPTKIGEGEASYTKVSAISFRITPMEPGSGITYKSVTQTGDLHKKYQRQAHKLVHHYLQQGIYGWEVTDALIELTDGRFDSMGSEPSHFNIIIPLALFRALKESKVKLLEPICDFYIKAPSENITLISKYLSGKKSIFEISGSAERSFIKGTTKLRNMLSFPIELHKMTRGRGEFSYNLSKYEQTYDIVESKYFGPDPRNEVPFVIQDMGGSLYPLDAPFTKKKKVSRSKFKRETHEEEMKRLKKNFNDKSR